MRASVVIPAHNEERSIARSLETLQHGLDGHEIDVVVVCNGCTDDTAAIARRAHPGARVIEIPQPSKAEAVRVGNAATAVFPRIHLDADVELSGQGLLALLRPLADGEVMAAAPRRRLPRDGCSWPVRWYYDVWEHLPQVRSGLFGRGVVALGAAGQERLATLPRLMSDDLVMSEAFAPRERRVVEDAVVVIHPPKTVGDLVRRRIRVATGVAQADRHGVRGREAGTSMRTLLRLTAERPGLAPRIPVFVGVALAARVGARRAIRAGDFATWQRDESSRR